MEAFEQLAESLELLVDVYRLEVQLGNRMLALVTCDHCKASRSLHRMTLAKLTHAHDCKLVAGLLGTGKELLDGSSEWLPGSWRQSFYMEAEATIQAKELFPMEWGMDVTKLPSAVKTPAYGLDDTEGRRKRLWKDLLG